MDDPTKLVFTPELTVLYASGRGHNHREDGNPSCPACEFWRRMKGAAAVAQAVQAVRNCAEILRSESSCGYPDSTHDVGCPVPGIIKRR